MSAPRDPVYVRICELVAGVLDVDAAAVLASPPTASLLGGELGLTSVTGAKLLVAIAAELGVDVAAEDLSLASLTSLRTLADFVAAHRAD